MSQYQSFFISASGNASQCEELNHFLRSHVVIRTVENIISGGNNTGIQILVEYKDKVEANQKDKKSARIDWRASLANDNMRVLFDRLKDFRLKFSKEKKLSAAYMVCKDEHLAAIVSKSNITVDEIKALPNAGNIMLSEFANDIFNAYQKILVEREAELVVETQTNEESEIPF